MVGRCILGGYGLCLLLLLGTAFADENWPQFRGPDQTGVANGANLPETWSETENIKWKTEIPERGWSTPVVMGGQVWLTTATIDDRRPDPKLSEVKQMLNGSFAWYDAARMTLILPRTISCQNAKDRRGRSSARS